MSDPNYQAKIVEKVETRPGCWGYLRVGVFDGETQIGEYLRNYPGLAEGTFFPFKSGERWFALYSRDYTATRIMSLPDCADLGGEDRHSHGFCPVEYYVPELTGQAIDPADPEPRVANHDDDKWAHKTTVGEGGNSCQRWYWPDDKDGPTYSPERAAEYLAEKDRSHRLHDEWSERHPFMTRHAAWGLVAGCYWGDDTSWKVQFLDLSRAADGVLARDDRFGYLELPRGVKLRDAVDADCIHVLNDPPEKQRIAIAVPARFTLAGKRLED